MIIFLLSHTPCSHEYDVDDAGDADDAGDDEDDDDGVDIDEDENDTNDAWVMQARKSDDPLPSSFPFSRSQPSFPAAALINYHTDSNVGDNDDDEMMMMKTTVMTAMMMLMMMTAMTMHWLIREVQQCCGLLIIPHICHFWYATIFFKPVKGTPKKCVNSRQKLPCNKTA